MLSKILSRLAVIACMLTAAKAYSADDQAEQILKSLYIFYDYDMPMRVNGTVYPIELSAMDFVNGRFGKAFLYESAGTNQYPNEIASAEKLDQFTPIQRRRVKDATLKATEITLGEPDMADVEKLAADNNDKTKKEPKANRLELYDDAKPNVSADELKIISDPDSPAVKIIEASKGRLTVKEQTFGTHVDWRVSYADLLVVSAYVKGPAGAELDLEVAMTPFPEALEKVTPKWIAFHKRENPKYTSFPPFVPDASFPQKVKLTGEWQRVAAYARFDCRLNDRKSAFNLVMNREAPLLVKQLQFQIRPDNEPFPTAWIPGKTSRRGNSFSVAGADLVKDFPETEGTLSFWMKYPDRSNLAYTSGPIFVFDKWNLGEEGFSMNGLNYANPVDKKDMDWQFITFVWDKNNVTTYRNGNQVLSRKRVVIPMKDISDKAMFLGYSGFRGAAGAGIIIDEFAVFKKALTPGDVKFLYEQKVPLLANSREYMSTVLSGGFYFRNENPARLVFSLFAPCDEAVTAKVRIGDVQLPERKIELKKGKVRLVIPFDAYVFDCGTYPLRIEMYRSNGEKCFGMERNIEILPRFERDEFRILSWGGSNQIDDKYIDMAGMNTVHTTLAASSSELARYARRGRHFCPNLGNCGAFFSEGGYNKDAIAGGVEYALDKFSGYNNWSMTLCNTEVYGIGWIDSAKNIKRWTDYAEKKLGHAPSYGIVNGFGGLLRPKDWVEPKDGILEMDNALHTFLWATHEGQPPLLVNEVNTETIRRLSPGNIVWSEPLVPHGVVMTASWEYDYSPYLVLYGVKDSYNAVKKAGKEYMPTLSMSYWPEQWGGYEQKDAAKAKKDDVMSILNDKMDDDGGANEREAAEAAKVKKQKIPVQLAQTYDELVIKTYIALGAVRSGALSIFALDAWPEGEKNIKLPEPPEKCLVADPDCGKKYGEMVRNVFFPMAEMMKDMEPVPQKVAVFVPDSSRFTANMGWTNFHFLQAFKDMIGGSYLDYDVLGDNERPEKFKEYKYIFFPAARSVTRENYDKLCKAADTAKIYIDLHCRQTYPGMQRYDDPADSKKRWTLLKELCKKIREELKPELDIWADGDKGGVFAFKRTSGETPYFVVVNDARTKGNLNKYNSGEWYKPYGLAQNVKISMKIPQNSIVYDFAASKQIPYKYENGRAVIETQMEAAQGMVLCVYPRAFKEIKASASNLKPSAIVKIRVELFDESGKTVKGRQYVELKLQDDKGNIRDESGGCLMKDGVAEIPVYLSAKESAKELKAEFTEKTSGLKHSCSFKTDN